MSDSNPSAPESSPPLQTETYQSPSSASTAPVMSTPETLGNIFFEPGRTFEALRERPRFLVVLIIAVVIAILVTFLLFQRVDYARFMRDQIEQSPQAAQMSPEQKDQAVGFWTGPVGSVVIYLFPIIGTLVTFAAGGALYLLGTMMMGGRITYRQAISVWAYSSFPPLVLGSLIAIVVLFLKSPDDIDVSKPGGGLVIANLAVLLGRDASPVLTALLGSIDVLAFYGLFLAAIGLHKVGRMSSGAAWSVVVGLWVIGVVLKVAWAAAGFSR